MSQADIEKITKENPYSLIIVDEAYLGFSNIKNDVKYLLNSYNNIVFCRTFSKLYGLAGVRIGYGLCAPMAKQVFKLDLNPFRVSNLGRKAAVAALQDKAYYQELTKNLSAVRDNFIEEINKLDKVKAFKSAANFIFIHFDNSIDTQKLKDYLAQNGILVRLWTENGQLAMRITVAPEEWMEKTLELIKNFLEK